MTDSIRPILVAALYRFVPFADHAALQGPLAQICCANGVKGTLLLAHEGINGTIAGPENGIARVIDHIRALPGCADLDVKYSETDTMPFHRMKVRLKREIVTMGQPDIDPLADVGHYVEPEDWNALLADENTILIDTRNDYEVAVGTFANAIDPRTKSFREFPDWFRAHRESMLEGKPAPKIAMFCTGGIRCEKATAFVKAEGLENVFHLKGGILKYLETVPQAESLWEGECFVFDQRATVTHDLSPGQYELCHACRLPVSPADRQSPLYEVGVSCPACHGERDARQKAGYAERELQSQLAKARGEEHVGAVYPRPHRDD